jgi:hypothetical protein
MGVLSDLTILFQTSLLLVLMWSKMVSHYVITVVNYTRLLKVISNRYICLHPTANTFSICNVQ